LQHEDKGQSNLAKGDFARLIMTSGTAHICNRLGGKIWRGKELTDVSQILTQSGRDIGLSFAKEIMSISSAVSAQFTNVRDDGTVTWIPVNK